MEAAEGFDFLIRDVVINAGAEMIVAIAGDIMRMPGLPKHPRHSILIISTEKSQD